MFQIRDIETLTLKLKLHIHLTNISLQIHLTNTRHSHRHSPQRVLDLSHVTIKAKVILQFSIKRVIPCHVAEMHLMTPKFLKYSAQ